MMLVHRLACAVPCLTLVLAVAAGCARDGAFEPRGSIKDSPATAPPRHAMAAKPAVVKPLPRSAEPTTPADERLAVAPAPPPATTSAPQLVSPPPQAIPPPVHLARRPLINGVQLLEEGRVLFRAGEVLAARERYVAALSAPLPEVLLELARTYDPSYLGGLPKSDAPADRDRARALYEQAAALGSKAAEADLTRLQSSGPTTR